MNFSLKHLHWQLIILIPAAVFFILICIPPAQAFAATYYYNVTDYGAAGYDQVDDTAAIQKALDEATEDSMSVIKIPAGTYYISKPLYIQSNTTLQLDKKATIYRSNKGLKYNMLKTADASHVSTGYKGYSLAHDITITGGTWDGGNIASSKKASNLLYIGHSSNVTIKNTTIKNCYGSHAIEFAGVQNGIIKNCKLSGFRYGPDNYTSEAIQLDICYKSGSTDWTPGFTSDKTVCSNILIENNTITDYPRGIGSHHVLNGHYSNNITIRNNKISRSSTATQGKCLVGIFLMGTSNVSVYNNTINHYYYGVMIKLSKQLRVRNNYFKYNTSGGLVYENCDTKDIRRKFTVTKDTIGKRSLQYTCPGLINGYVKTRGKTYRFKKYSKKHKVKLKYKIKANQQLKFYGKDRWGNRYYRIYYVVNSKKS